MKTTNDYKIWENPNKPKIEIKSRKKLEKGNWINTEKINYEENGVPGVWENITRGTNDGVVAVLPITKDGNIILTEEIRIPLINKNCDGRVLGMPAGLIDKGENKKQATKREMMEEIGFKSKKIHYVDTIASSEGMTDEEVDIFIAINCKKVKDIIEGFNKVNGFILKHEDGEAINSIYSVPYKEIYDFMDMAKNEGMKKGGKIDCALNHLERKFRSIIKS